MNGVILIAGAEVEQKLMWGTTRDTRAGAIRAVCLETGLFLKTKIAEKTTFPVGWKLVVEIELSPRHE